MRLRTDTDAGDYYTFHVVYDSRENVTNSKRYSLHIVMRRLITLTTCYNFTHFGHSCRLIRRHSVPPASNSSRTFAGADSRQRQIQSVIAVLSAQEQRMSWTTLTAVQCIIYHPIITSCASSQELSGFSRNSTTSL